jgi:hypothetical protein
LNLSIFGIFCQQNAAIRQSPEEPNTMKGKVQFRNQRTTLQAKYNWDVSEILRAVHEGDCGHYAADKSLISKAFWQRFFGSPLWRMQRRFSNFVKVASVMQANLMYLLLQS